MTDVFDEPRFEQDLRAVLVDLAPDAAPGVAARGGGAPCLLDARASPRPAGGLLIAVVGLAAAVVIAVVGIGLVGGRLPVGPAVAPPTGGVPSAVPSPSPAAVTLTFDVVTPDGSMATKTQTDAVGSVMAARLRAYGIGTFSSSYSDDRITFEMALLGTRARHRSPRCATCSASPARSRSGSLGATALEPGDRVEGSPLFTGDAVTAARLAANGSGAPTLVPGAGCAGRDGAGGRHAEHVGEYLVIALDGRAVAAPMINEEIVDGRDADLASAATTRRRRGSPRSCSRARCHCRSRRSRPECARPRSAAVSAMASASGSAAIGRQCGRGVGRREAGDLRDQAADPQALDRTQGVERHPLEPDRRPEADGVGAGPEVLAAVVEVADAAVGDDRQPDAGVAQLGDDPQADRLDRRPRDRAVAVLEQRLAGLRVQAQALDGVDRRDAGTPVTARRGAPASRSPRRARP